MTGFGKADVVACNKKITAELKSLNSKQLDLSVKIPQSYREKELDIRNIIAQRLLRGKVELFISSEDIFNEASFSLNMPQIKHYKEQIAAMVTEMGLDEPTDLCTTLLRLPDSIKSDTATIEVDAAELEALMQVVRKAVDALIAFRTQEGKRLEAFFEEKIANIQSLLNQVPEFEESRVEKIKGRILDSLEKIDGMNYDKNRFEQELIFYIEKLDITEEKIRLQNHLKYFLDTLHGGDGQGKKLGFIAQEMGREINTMGSKANEAELQKIVVRMKDHLEQIKEQVLNVL